MNDIEKLTKECDELNQIAEKYREQLEKIKQNEEYYRTNDYRKTCHKLYKVEDQMNKINSTIRVYTNDPIASNEVIDLYKAYDDLFPYGKYLICLHDTKTVIGGTGCNPYSNNNVHYVIDQEYRGNGYAYQAVSVLIDYLASKDVEYVSLLIEKNNIPSIRTAEKLQNYIQNVDIQEYQDTIGYQFKINQKIENENRHK